MNHLAPATRTVDPAWLPAHRREARADALEEAARYVENFRMPRDGKGPVLLLDVISKIAHDLRGMK